MVAQQFRMRPGRWLEAYEWIMDRIQERERERGYVSVVSVGPPEEVPTFTPIPRPIKSLRMGLYAFNEARTEHLRRRIRLVDYVDGIGPRVRVGGLVADLRDDLDGYVIEVE